MIIVLINYIIIIIMYSTRKTPKKKVVKKIIKRKKKKPKKPKTISKDIKQSVKQAVQVIIETPKQKSRPRTTGLQPKATSIRDNITRPSLVQVIREERDNRLEILNEVRKKQQERFTRQQQQQLESQQEELRQIRLEQQNLLDDINFKDAMNEPPKIYPTPTEVMNLLNRVEQSRRPPPQEEEEEKDEFFDPIEEPVAQPVRQPDPVVEPVRLTPSIPIAKPTLQPKKEFSDKPLNMFDEMKKNPIFLKQKEKEKGLNEKKILDEKQAEEKTPSPPQEEEEKVIEIKTSMKKNATDIMTGKKIAGFQDKLNFIKKNKLKQQDKNGALREVVLSTDTPANIYIYQ